jgi:DNA gyrase subunit A
MKLQRLTGLARAEIVANIEQLEREIAELRGILEDKNKLLEIIRTELLEMRSKYADARRTEITNDYSNIDDEDLIPQEDIVISLTINGYIKRVTTDTYRTQNRGGRGVTGMTTHEDDIVDQLLITNTHTDVLFFTNTGRVYRIRGYKIPEFSRQSKGLPIINLLNMDKKEKVQAMISIDNNNITGDEKLLFVSTNGISKRVSIEEFKNIRQNGKIAVTLKEGDELFAVRKTNGNEDVIIAASNGKAVRFAEENIRCMGRTATGVKSINVGDGKVVGVSTSSQGEYVLVLTSKGYGKMSHIDEYRVMSNRGGKGVKTVNVTDKNGELVCLKAVKGDEDLLVVTNKGVIIRISLEQVKVASRNTQGVRIIKIADNSVVSSIAVVDKEELAEEISAENETENPIDTEENQE